ncbi:DUF1905 domain-containing protein [Carboxylicivirga mesophila]|uniref:DUF1905 domain-containing protein n=1 Tax=Carboxylicivirga mesophila TaxID=1166478 RepID=A0ABS5KCM0_9BACT|nr:YdeI/OmpD-associated family protein [Carboxylicivirga mesophila]MBS2212572.1 DUF1905 domain-containing protein [Carboxylicivirga mesophila]
MMSLSNKTALVDKKYLLNKFPGKGGWTYAEIPEVAPDKHAWFNWVKVHGSINGFSLKHARLMPLGNGQLFLPVKAAIRKAIGKEAGDWVHIILYPDNIPVEVPQDLIDCLALENSKLFDEFVKQSANQQQEIIDWIYAAKKDETKARRINKVIDYLQQKIK